MPLLSRQLWQPKAATETVSQTLNTLECPAERLGIPALEVATMVPRYEPEQDREDWGEPHKMEPDAKGRCVLYEDYLTETARVRNALKWALDLLDMYDERLVKMGDPPALVYSDIHLNAKTIARAMLEE